jgi:uncharacterized protein YkwD
MRYAAIHLLLVALFAASACPSSAQEKKDPGQLTEEEKNLFDLINKERAKEKLPPLAFNAKLQRSARAHSENMAKQDKLEHVLDGKTPGNRADAAGYDFLRIGENIAYVDGGTPEETVKGWMESKPHRENILKREFKDTGVAVAVNARGVKYVTQVFAVPNR